MIYNNRQILLISYYETESGGARGTHGAEDAYRPRCRP
jgi:hypothetical protein